MAEDLIELGLEGFDRLVDKYHDIAYDTATDGAGRIWKKVRLPGRRKSVFVEQNASQGQKPEIVDPAKDQLPPGFKPGKGSPRDDRRNYDDYEYDRGRRDDRREPSIALERDYSGNDNLDWPRKSYSNDTPWPTNGGYPPPPPPQGTYFSEPPRAPINDYGPPPGPLYDPGQYLGPAAAATMIAQNEQPAYVRENQPWSRDESLNRLGRQRSYDGRYRRDYDSESDFSPPRRRRRPRSEAPKDRRKSKDKEYSLTAGLAGAVAGGFLGRSLGKGDLVTTTAGAIVGALGADIIADGRARSKKEKREKEYDRKDRY